MELFLYNSKDKIKLSPLIFKYKFNESTIHQVIVSYQCSLRTGNSSQKNRSEVAGSNKKPWRQKGTGKARAGSKKSPIWRSGGVTFASKPKKYKKKINKKMLKCALKSIFSKLILQNRLIIVKEFCIKTYKTKELIKKIQDFFIKNALIITSEIDKNLILSSRNIHKIKICDTNHINPIHLIKFEKTVITIDALKQIEKKLK